MSNAAAQERNLDDLGQFLVAGQAGDYVFREGEASRDMYIIQEGRLELLKRYAGDERQLAVLDVGDFFGEWSLLEEVAREVSARGLTEYRLLRIDQSTFHQIVREDPDIAVRMLRRLAQRLSERQAADIRAAEIAMGGFRGATSKPATVPAAAEEAAAASGRPATPAAPSGVPALRAGDRTFDLAPGCNAVVGRSDRAKGYTPDIDLTDFDSDRTLSRRHARVIRKDDGVYVREETGVRNGTFVNGHRVTAGAEVKLQNTDRVRFGLVETVFRWL